MTSAPQKMGLLDTEDLTDFQRTAIGDLLDQETPVFAARVLDKRTGDPVIILSILIDAGETTAVTAPVAILIDHEDPAWRDRLTPPDQAVEVRADEFFGGHGEPKLYREL